MVEVVYVKDVIAARLVIEFGHECKNAVVSLENTLKAFKKLPEFAEVAASGSAKEID
jgi:hypothetical protein